MPLPSVEPTPPVPAELRFSVPLEAQDASYFAASDKIASLRRSDRTVIKRSPNVHFDTNLRVGLVHIKKT